MLCNDSVIMCVRKEKHHYAVLMNTVIDAWLSGDDTVMHSLMLINTENENLNFSQQNFSLSI